MINLINLLFKQRIDGLGPKLSLDSSGADDLNQILLFYFPGINYIIPNLLFGSSGLDHLIPVLYFIP